METERDGKRERWFEVIFSSFSTVAKLLIFDKVQRYE